MAAAAAIGDSQPVRAVGRQAAGRQVQEAALEALLKASTRLAVDPQDADHRSKCRSATELQLRRAQELSGDPR